jgi:transcriptional regulator NrdR family protein
MPKPCTHYLWQSSVIDSRPNAVKHSKPSACLWTRRRVCIKCNQQYTTYEIKADELKALQERADLETTANVLFAKLDAALHPETKDEKPGAE